MAAKRELGKRQRIALNIQARIDAADTRIRELETENQCLRTVLAQAEGERIALADAFREYMEFHHISPTDAAMGVQEIIDGARGGAKVR